MNLEALCADSMPAIGQIAHEIWLKSADLTALQVSEKSAGDVATDIDLWAELVLREKLTALLPGSQFLGEETGGALSDAPTWIVDPIDGTANFTRGYPQWSVSVALSVQGKPVLGVIVDPNRGETFYATTGQGAWLQSRQGVRQLFCATAREPLKATVSTVFPKPLSPLMKPYLAEFAQ
jgi:myo-inositol-1(or 4)-monophosphatase